MRLKRLLGLVTLLLMSMAALAQINIYLGGNLQGNVSRMRGENPSVEPGFGGGLNFVYWEYEYWFIKAGLDYNMKSSSRLDYPDNFDVEINEPGDKLQIGYTEQTLGVPLVVYFRPVESNGNCLLITGSLETIFVSRLKESTEELGEVVLRGNEVNKRTKTNVGIGVGYQRQLEQHTYLNIVPSFHTDIRADRAFNSITLTVELIFGVY